MISRHAQASTDPDRTPWLRLALALSLGAAVSLGITAQEPLLRIESIAYGANGRPVEHYRALHRCQSSRLHVKTTT